MRRNKLTCLKVTGFLTLIVFFLLNINLLVPEDQDNVLKKTRMVASLRTEDKHEEVASSVKSPKSVRVKEVGMEEKSLVNKDLIGKEDKEIVENDKKDNVEDVEKEDKEKVGLSDNSLAGERMNGLPNSTSEEKKTISLGIGEILRNIYEANKDQVIRNEEMFGPVNNFSTVIVVQVHNRANYLRHLITSFSLAQGIEKTLLVFSHDLWDEDINSLVRSVDFAPSLQIFYPFSLQTHPLTFPGEEEKDCPRNVKPAQAKTLKCTNANWPDIHGHYREAKFTQTKHHWWWKANHVFHNLEITKKYEGIVLFLEEDHYVAEDFLHVLELMKREQRKNSYGQVDILSLGTYLRRFNPKSKEKQAGPQGWPVPHLLGLPHPHQALARNLKAHPPARHLLWAPSFLSSLLTVFHKAEVTQWISAKHNMGMAFTRGVWDKMTQCSSKFCQYDDYNWDWSLQQLSLNCLKEKLQVMMVRGPRVFHIGECGVHHKKSDCDSNIVIEKVKSILKTAKEYLFPDKLSITQTSLRKKLKMKKGNGGWGDKRDHALCLNMTVNA